MRMIFDYADQYIKQSDWKDLALLKFCLCAVGVMIGLSVPKEKKKYPLIIAAVIFAVTYVPLMAKFVRVVLGYYNLGDAEAEQ